MSTEILESAQQSAVKTIADILTKYPAPMATRVLNVVVEVSKAMKQDPEAAALAIPYVEATIKACIEASK